MAGRNDGRAPAAKKDATRHRTKLFGTGLGVPAAVPMSKTAMMSQAAMRKPATSQPAMASTGGFVPKATVFAAIERRRIDEEREQRALAGTWAPGEGKAASGAETLGGGLDLFGLRTAPAGAYEEGDDDLGGGGGGFWMPNFAVVAEEAPVPKKEAQLRPEEVFDGYHVWRKWDSKTAGKPFWHCKETGEQRWERPEVQLCLSRFGRLFCGISGTHPLALERKRAGLTK